MADNSEQWARVRESGLTIVISEPKGADVAIGWVNADAVEDLLKVYAELVTHTKELVACVHELKEAKGI